MTSEINKKKRFLKTLLFLIMVFKGMAISTVYAEETYTEGYFIYERDGDSIVITGYFGNEEEVNVPDYLGGLDVDEIKGSVFRSPKIKTIRLPESITCVSDDVFVMATGLEVVYVSSDVELSLPEHALIIRDEAEYAEIDDVYDDTDKGMITDQIDDTDVAVLDMSMEYEGDVITGGAYVSFNTVEAETADDIISDEVHLAEEMASEPVFEADPVNYNGVVLLIYGTVIVAVLGLFWVLHINS